MIEGREDVNGAGFGSEPRQLRYKEFGVSIPRPFGGAQGKRIEVLIQTLERLEEASPTAKYHRLAQENLRRWRKEAEARETVASCEIRVLPGDWGAVTHELTKEFGVCFASLNMANAECPGGGYANGMIAQEENMFRRTDCHFSLNKEEFDDDMYDEETKDILNAKGGRVYLDVDYPRVCIRGAEDRHQSDLGYEWLPDEEVFPFYELRAAAMDLRGGLSFDQKETERRIAAQLDTLIDKKVRHVVLSAFGCGAFLNPAERVAALYRQEIEKRMEHFDVIAFGIFNAGYGPSNFEPFMKEFKDLIQGTS